MAIVESDLYDFIKERENHLCRKNNRVEFLLFIDFQDLPEFVKIIGADHFDEDGMEVTMKDSYLCVELTDVIERFGHEVKDYKKCFSEWYAYFDKNDNIIEY